MPRNRSEAIGSAVHPNHEAFAVNQDVARQAQLGRRTETEGAIHASIFVPHLRPIHILFPNKRLPDFGIGGVLVDTYNDQLFRYVVL